MESKARYGERVAMESPDFAEEQVARLKELFPEAFNEGKVDFDKLRAALGDLGDDSPERYSFTWAGKRDAIRLLQTPSRATLTPSVEESVDFETTRNVFIEGDNLEVLKLLYKAYDGRVKMIYIDPPYNTGNDFIYPDNYADPLETYLRLTGQTDAEGNLLTSNPETSGRYHSAWLSMMYPRLFLARQLLREDGVIFVSIDDHEVHNLKLMMNEIYGEENFVAQFTWKSRQFPDSRAKTHVSVDHEYILLYSRRSDTRLRGIERDETKFSNPDNDPRGRWMSRSLLGLATPEQRPNLHYVTVNPNTGHEFSPPTNSGWRYSRARMEALIADGRILFPQTPDGRPREKKFRADMEDEYIALPSIIDDVFTANGTAEISKLFGDQVFDFPKPAGLIGRFCEQSTSDGDIILDFFAGVCTTAQAALELNREDGDNRCFITVQLPEPTDNPMFPTIADVGKERIRRVIARMQGEREGQLPLEARQTPEDLGFKVFKLAPSNYRSWKGSADTDPEVYAEQMGLFADPLVDGWTVPDVIWEVAVKEGYGLDSHIERVEAVADANVYRVADPDREQFFFICLDDIVRVGPLESLELSKDTLFVCRDAALDDETAANLALQCRLKTI